MNADGDHRQIGAVAAATCAPASSGRARGARGAYGGLAITSRERLRVLVGHAASRASTITRSTGSVPEGRKQHAPASPSAARPPAPRDRVVRLPVVAFGRGTLISRCGKSVTAAPLGERQRCSTARAARRALR
jgi:hypothetical protein